MYVPTTLAQPAGALAPAGIVATLAPVGIVSTAPLMADAVGTAMSVRSTELNVLEDHQATVSGTLRPGLAGRVILLQALENHRWTTLARARTRSTGRFRLRYRPHRTGSEQVRLRFAGDPFDLDANRRLGSLNVYRLAEASWYSGGGSLACGGSLTSSTMGVANKTLPCGTLVTLRYGGHSVRVPVVDRGPYVAGREFDLTEATKQALGFGDTGEVWSSR